MFPKTGKDISTGDPWFVVATSYGTAFLNSDGEKGEGQCSKWVMGLPHSPNYAR